MLEMYPYQQGKIYVYIFFNYLGIQEGLQNLLFRVILVSMVQFLLTQLEIF